MSLPVALRDPASAEFDEAFDWYESRKAGLGVEFVAEIEAVFDRISVAPLAYRTVRADIRKAVVRRFPTTSFSEFT